MLALRRLTVGAYETNCYLLEDRSRGTGVLVDPGDEAEAILDWIGGLEISTILITHGHADHVGALEEVRTALNCSVGGHAADAELFGLEFDFTLEAGSRVAAGADEVETFEVPGHTPGSMAFAFGETHIERALVGDSIFPGGPGQTKSAQDLKQLLQSLEQTVFTWPDEVELFPGHGDSTTVGKEREPFERFRSQGLPDDLFGDVTWR